MMKTTQACTMPLSSNTMSSTNRKKFDKYQRSPSRRQVIGLFKLAVKVVPNITIGSITSFGSSA